MPDKKPEIVNVFEAKTQLSKYLERVENGEEIVISRYDRPIAKLVPYKADQHGGPKIGRITVNFELADGSTDSFSIENSRH